MRLTNDEELRLWESKDTKARDELFFSYSPLIIYLSRFYCQKYRATNLFEDCKSVCGIGVLKAIRFYNPSKGVFNKYVKAIMQRELIEFLETKELIRIPKYLRKLIKNDEDGDPFVNQARQIREATVLNCSDFEIEENQFEEFDSEEVSNILSKLRDENDFLSRIIYLRYFKNRTYREMAQDFPLCYRSLCRAEKKALKRLRELFSNE